MNCYPPKKKIATLPPSEQTAQRASAKYDVRPTDENS